ncbi:MAG: C40 family peptidase [Candidatus Thiodiazotropha sp.]
MNNTFDDPMIPPQISYLPSHTQLVAEQQLAEDSASHNFSLLHFRPLRRTDRLTLTLCLLILFAMTGCGTSPYVSPQHTTTASPPIEATHNAVRTALAQLNKPYRYGGKTPRGFDCSGLIYYAYQRSGLAIPRTTAEQLRNSHTVALEEIAPGDLLFFRQRKKRASHVGLYVGDGRFIHASTSEQAVILSRLDSPYWINHLVAVGRYLE